ncbi:MAG: DUF4760 domain-containing protein [Terriglobales bacterium]
MFSYWQIAASLALNGTLHPTVFVDTCGEGLFIYAKFKPLLKDIRAKMDPEFLSRIETLVQKEKVCRDRVAVIEKRLAAWAAARKAQEAVAAD